jgi:hypothetical protein
LHGSEANGVGMLDFGIRASSFANTAGGDLIIGIAADSGVPIAFAPLATEPDSDILRLENIARNGLQLEY